MSNRTWLRALVVASVTAGTAVAGVAAASPSFAAAPDGPLSGTPSTMWQTNAQVTNLAYSNGVLYAGGDFTAVRPPGVAQGGTGTVSRSYLAAFNASTGALITSFNVALNGKVRALNVSPDGSTLYVGGNFTTAGGATHNRLAAINLSTNAVSSWKPSVNNTVDAIYSTSSAVYIGGVFTLVNSVSHKYLAALSPSTGSPLSSFTGSADNTVDALAMSSDSSRLLVGGNFNTISGVSQHGLAAIDPTTGNNLSWSGTAAVPGNSSCNAEVSNLVVSGPTVYASETGDQPGCNDGDFAANVADGSTLWLNDCEGGTQTIEVVNGVLYKGSHNHDCAHEPGGAFGGFTGLPARQTNTVYRHLAAQSEADGSFLHWDPDTNASDGQGIGPVAMATDGTQLFLGGDFTTVNGSAQRGLTRFQPKGVNTAPKKPSAAPTVVGTGAGQLTVTMTATTDIDSGNLTYKLYRDSSTTPIYTTTAESWPWASPTIRYTDTGLTAGSSHTYRFTASDGTTTTAYSPTSASTKVPSAGLGSYATAVQALSPSLYWKLDDATSGTAADSSGHSLSGTYESGTSDTSGAYSGDDGVATDGSNGFVTANSTSTPGSTWSESIWFKTSTVVGGDLIGFSDSKTGTDANSNYTIRMDNDGQVVAWFSTQAPQQTQPGPPPGPTTIRSARSYNDGHWHNAVVTYDGTTQTLYVDGVSVGTATVTANTPFAGYWRAGYVNLDNANDVFGNQYFQSIGLTSPESYHFQGSLDDMSVYPSALTAAQVANLWATNGNAG